MQFWSRKDIAWEQACGFASVEGLVDGQGSSKMMDARSARPLEQTDGEGGLVQHNLRSSVASLWFGRERATLKSLKVVSEEAQWGTEHGLRPTFKTGIVSVTPTDRGP